jgi:DNA-3-methyladenine glycosylase I
MTQKTETRCGWSTGSPLMIAYHDEEWGVPERDDRALFEKLILDGFQAGLSWSTILNKRLNFRRAFDGFEPEKIARYTQNKRDKLMNDAGIIRNRAKIEASVTNARAFLAIMEAGPGSFSDYLWQFADGVTIRNKFRTWKQIPAESKESQAMSKSLKAQGFRFCGPTICYAFMQAVGMVNDHVVTCFRHTEV